MQGSCYCGALRYDVTADPVMKGQCHCRECQYISGGGPNYYMVVPNSGFSYAQGTPAAFARTDLETPVTREFCGTCGTHILTRRPGLEMVILKAGTLDQPSDYGAASLAIFLKDAQPFHMVPEDMPCFDGMPPRK